jgi:hypothetical protein
MATLHTKDGRLIAFAVVAIGFAFAAVPEIATPGATSATASPIAVCLPGQQQDPVMLVCAPIPAPDAVGVAPGLDQQWQEQDIYGTPGEQPDRAGGTAVP